MENNETEVVISDRLMMEEEVITTEEENHVEEVEHDEVVATYHAGYDLFKNNMMLGRIRKENNKEIDLYFKVSASNIEQINFNIIAFAVMDYYTNLVSSNPEVIKGDSRVYHVVVYINKSNEYIVNIVDNDNVKDKINFINDNLNIQSGLLLDRIIGIYSDNIKDFEITKANIKSTYIRSVYAKSLEELYLSNETVLCELV